MNDAAIVTATGRVVGNLAKQVEAEQRAVRNDIAGLRELAFDLKSQIATVKDIAEARGDHVARLALEQSELMVRSGRISEILEKAETFADKVKALEAIARSAEQKIFELSPIKGDQGDRGADAPVLVKAFEKNGEIVFATSDGAEVPTSIVLEDLRGGPGIGEKGADAPKLVRAFSDDGRIAFEDETGKIVKSEIEIEALRGRPGADRPIVSPMVAREGVKYERHSVVVHKGGLAIAARDTIGGPGEDPDAFTPIVRGIENVEISYDPIDARDVTISIAMSDGESEIFDFNIPAVRFCDRWKDAEYKPGDLVSHSRGLWIANEETEAEPGKSDSWRLALKLPKGDKGDKGDTVKGDPGASIASIVFDEETKAFVFGTSDGEAIAVPVEKAAPFDSTTPGLSRYRGVYDSGTAYDQGDVVTRGQALIVAKRAVPAGADPRLAENFDTMIDAGAFMPTFPIVASDWNRQRALTQAEYDGLAVKDAHTFYAIVE